MGKLNTRNNIFPIWKKDKSYCPNCMIELKADRWEDHTTKEWGHKMGSEGWILKCPKCNREFYDAVKYYD